MSQPRFITPKMRRDMSIVPSDYWRALRQGFNPDKPLSLVIPLFQPVMTVNATRAELAAKRAMSGSPCFRIPVSPCSSAKSSA